MNEQRHQKMEQAESGMVVLEATFCIVVCIFVIMLLMSVGFYLYQRVMVDVVANEVAENVTETYKLLSAKDASRITVSDIEGTGLYRYYFFSGTFLRNNEEKGRKYVNARLSKTSLAQESSGGPEVTIEQIHDDIGRFHYVIEVKQGYRFLWTPLLERIGIKNTTEMTATACAEGVDVFHYVNAVNTYKYITGKAGGSSVGKVIESGIKIIKSIHDLFKPDTEVESGGDGGGGFR